MADSNTEPSKLKIYAMVILVAMAVGVISVVIQRLVLGHSSTAISGGAAGAVGAVLAVLLLGRRKAA